MRRWEKVETCAGFGSRQLSWYKGAQSSVMEAGVRTEDYTQPPVQYALP